MEQFICHLFGDYVIQSDWMASQKTKSSLAALCHAVSYSLVFLFLRPSWTAFAVICLTHFVIDRWRLARYVVWAKNWLCPFWQTKCSLETGYRAERVWVSPLADCQATGYPPDRPAWLAVWLLIIADNTLHLAINYLSLRYL